MHHHGHHHHHHHHHPQTATADKGLAPPATGGIRGLNFFRSRSVPPGPRDGAEGKAVSAPQSPVPSSAALPPILKEGTDTTTVPQPEPAAIEFANPPTIRAPPVRSGSLPPGADVPLEAMLRAGAGAGRRGRPATGAGARGRFKSNPIMGTRGEGTAGDAAADSGTTAATVAAAVPIDGDAKRTSGPESHAQSTDPSIPTDMEPGKE